MYMHRHLSTFKAWQCLTSHGPLPSEQCERPQKVLAQAMCSETPACMHTVHMSHFQDGQKGDNSTDVPRLDMGKFP